MPATPAPQNPENVPHSYPGITREQLAQAAVDPYNLWAVDSTAVWTYGIVHAGLAYFIAAQRRCYWDLCTEPKTPQHLARDIGLQVWALYEAEHRMSLHLLPAYSVVDFSVLHFAEAIRDGGNLDDPEWEPLIQCKLAARDKKFFEHIGLMMGKKGNWEHRAMMQFCLLWDRGLLPLEYWAVPAAVVFLREVLVACHIPVAGVTEHAVRQWILRLGLKRAMPPVVLKYWDKHTTPRFDHEAAQLHGLIIDCSTDQ